MDLMKAAIGVAGGVLADQWKKFFYCDSMSPDVLMMKGQKVYHDIGPAYMQRFTKKHVFAYNRR